MIHGEGSWSIARVCGSARSASKGGWEQPLLALRADNHAIELQ